MHIRNKCKERNFSLLCTQESTNNFHKKQNKKLKEDEIMIFPLAWPWHRLMPIDSVTVTYYQDNAKLLRSEVHGTMLNIVVTCQRNAQGIRQAA
jgi:hypothetical protein